MKTIPMEIGDLIQLQTLDLRGNLLTAETIPKYAILAN